MILKETESLTKHIDLFFILTIIDINGEEILFNHPDIEEAHEES